MQIKSVLAAEQVAAKAAPEKARKDEAEKATVQKEEAVVQRAAEPAAAAARKAASGPSYNAMATAAILAMQERTGSSVMAITKWVMTRMA